MIFTFLNFLSETLHIHIPAAFFNTSSRMGLAAMTSLLFSILVGPYFIRKLYEIKVGHVVRVRDCPVLADLHAKKSDTPSMGGVMIVGAVTVASILWLDLRSGMVVLSLLLMWALCLLGLRDDYLKVKLDSTNGMSGRKKLFFQMVVGAVVASYLLIPAVAAGCEHYFGIQPPCAKELYLHGKEVLSVSEYASKVYVPFIKKPWGIDQGWALVGLFGFFLFMVSAFSNAVNLTDGLDGLAAGTVLLVLLVLIPIAFLSSHHEIAHYLNLLYIEGSSELAIFLSGVLGALIGFLWFNSHPAQIFMGDSGSLPLGGIVGLSAVLLRREFLIAGVGLIFFVEAMSVILQVASYRFRGGKRIFLCAPIHHHFQLQGWAESKVVFRFWIVGLILAILGILSIKFQ
ncbi:MAG: Phospho-N-acetylmuramoyl-pentapeptide-transferase [Chlamydiia bacterium]|nr:Phospho-N-acetylmuramoyl-pentapeptide-transferase [Chlamydiia bacterium]